MLQRTIIDFEGRRTAKAVSSALWGFRYHTLSAIGYVALGEGTNRAGKGITYFLIFTTAHSTEREIIFLETQ